ncbi:MAG: hypothetical protein AB8B39_04190 [Prochlorococcus sp.]
MTRMHLWRSVAINRISAYKKPAKGGLYRDRERVFPCFHCSEDLSSSQMNNDSSAGINYQGQA